MANTPHPSDRLTYPVAGHRGTVGRTDQGVDIGGIPAGTPILAIARERVIGIIPNWYRGQPFIWFKDLATGMYNYAAEQIIPKVRPGQIVEQGQTVAVEAASGTGDEFGYATASGRTLAQATTGYSEGQATPAGQRYRQDVIQGGRVRPGGGVVGPDGSGGGGGGGSGVDTLFTNYLQLRDMPRAAPPGTKNPAQWFLASFTGNWDKLGAGGGAATSGDTGAAPPSTPFKGGKTLGIFTATAYGPPWGGIEGQGTTATGIDLHSAPHDYIVAVDPNVIPLHSKLQISPNPFGDPNIVFRAEDTGGAIKGNRIDFYDWRGRRAQNGWGVRKVSIRGGR